MNPRLYNPSHIKIDFTQEQKKKFRDCKVTTKFLNNDLTQIYTQLSGEIIAKSSFGNYVNSIFKTTNRQISTISELLDSIPGATTTFWTLTNPSKGEGWETLTTIPAFEFLYEKYNKTKDPQILLILYKLWGECIKYYYSYSAAITSEQINLELNKLFKKKDIIENDYTLVRRVTDRIDHFCERNSLTKGFEIMDNPNCKEIIANAHPDFISEDTIWELKTSKSRYQWIWVHQLILYYIICQQVPDYKGITYIGIYNPLYDTEDIINLKDIREEIEYVWRIVNVII